MCLWISAETWVRQNNHIQENGKPVLFAGFALAVAIVAICEDFYFLAPKI